MNATRLVSVMVVFVLFSVYGFAQPPEIQWNRRYSTTADDYCATVLPTPDGGYLLCGSTFPMGGERQWDFAVVRTYADGDSLWSRTYGDSGWEECLAAQATIDGGFILAGSQIADGTIGVDFMLLKIDAQGDCLWSRTYGRVANDFCYAVLTTPDSSYLLAGLSLDIETGFGVGWLVKTDGNGDSLWSRIYEGDEHAELRGIQPSADHGYVLAGSIELSVQSDTRFWLLRINDNGDTLWSRTYNSPGRDRCYNVRQTSDGGYALTGRQWYYGTDTDFWLLKTDTDGDSMWSRTYGRDTNDETCYSVLQTTDGGYVLVGETMPRDTIDSDGWVVKTNADGDSLWNLRLGRTHHDRLEDALQSADGGFVLGGYTPQGDSVASQLFSDFWLVKLMPEMFASEALIPRSACLLTNYPNPFNSTTVLEFTIPRTSHVTIRAYDLLGRDAGTIADAVYGVGLQRIAWDGRNLASGVYWIRMSGDGFNLTRKAVLLR